MQVMRYKRYTGEGRHPDWQLQTDSTTLSSQWLDVTSGMPVQPDAHAMDTFDQRTQLATLDEQGVAVWGLDHVPCNFVSQDRYKRPRSNCPKYCGCDCHYHNWRGPCDMGCEVEPEERVRDRRWALLPPHLLCVHGADSLAASGMGHGH